MDSLQRALIFVSYIHTDAAWLERLKTHLKPLERQGPRRTGSSAGRERLLRDHVPNAS
jgi:hypothetical protein